MFFCFRWLLINFKRELSFDDIQCLWEAMWSNYLSVDLSLFIAASILLKYKTTILERRMGFDEILKVLFSLSLPNFLPASERPLWEPKLRGAFEGGGSVAQKI